MALPDKIIQEAIQDILDKISRGEFECIERKSKGDSVIGKPVDLHIRHKKSQKIIVCIEVTDVNSTQLVNEACRLYFDTCFRKILIIGTGNAPKKGKELCEEILKKLYCQNRIDDTPARVLVYESSKEENFKSELEKILRYFLVRY